MKISQDMIIGAALVAFSAPVLGSFIGSAAGSGAATFAQKALEKIKIPELALGNLDFHLPDADIIRLPDLDFGNLDLNPFPDLHLESMDLNPFPDLNIHLPRFF